MSDTRTSYDGSHHVGDESGGSLLGHIWASIAATLVLGVICCGLYPLAVWGIGQTFFPHQANGSLVKKDGTPTTDDSQAVGSALIGQSFTAPVYFHPRPSAANNSPGTPSSPTSYSPGGGYDATSSGGSNFGPLNDQLINGATVTTQPAAAPAATSTAAAPETTSAPNTATATAVVATTTAATAAAAAPSTQPVEYLAYDGIRLRVIHYALDNYINFKLYRVTYDQDGAISSRKELTPEEKAKFIVMGKPNDQGRVAGHVTDDKLMVDAFPHMDMSSPPPPAPPKQAVIADDFATLIPADAVTASGSGLDPHISPDNAALQAQRVVDERNKVSTVKLSKGQVLDLIKQNTDGPSLGILGDPGVNVLLLNLALDKVAPLPAPATTSAPAPAATTK